jgi:hypothetical protein
MLRIIKVAGNSLSPFFLSGDFVVLFNSQLLKQAYRAGDAIVFNHASHGILIKIVSMYDPDQQAYFVKGYHPESTNSDTLGLIPHQNVLGKVIWHIKRPRIET